MTRLGNMMPSAGDLSFLTRDGAGRSTGAEVRSVPLEHISESDRLRLREPPYSEIENLAAAIQDAGQSTPLFVRPADDGRFELISGYRRRAALESIGATSALVRVFHNLSDADAFKLAVSENADRRDLTDWERAMACKRMREDEVGIEDIARRFQWKTRKTVENHLRVAREARPVLRQALQTGELTITHAVAALKAIASHALTEEQQDTIIGQIMAARTSAAQIPSFVDRLAKPPTEQAATSTPALEGWHCRELKSGAISFRGHAKPDDPAQLEALANELSGLLRKLRSHRRKLLSESEPHDANSSSHSEN